MSKLFKNVKVEMETDYFDIEISDDELEQFKKWGIDIDNSKELINSYLENYGPEWEDKLSIENVDFEEGLQ